MLKRHVLICAVCFTLPALSAYAIDRPKLPASAKKIGGEDIQKLYDGSTVSFNNFTKPKSLIGTVTYDFKKGTQSGDYVFDKKIKGSFTGTVRIDGDKLCFKSANDPEQCVNVYVSGADIFEVSADGLIVSANKKK